MADFIVTMQTLENYGAHSGTGKFSDGQAHWKLKGEDTVLVRGVRRDADAMAAAMAHFGCNNLGWKRFPARIESYGEWLDHQHAEVLAVEAEVRQAQRKLEGDELQIELQWLRQLLEAAEDHERPDQVIDLR